MATYAAPASPRRPEGPRRDSAVLFTRVEWGAIVKAGEILDSDEFSLIQYANANFEHVLFSTDGSLRRLARLVLRIAKLASAVPTLLYFSLAVMEDILGLNDPESSLGDVDLLRERAKLFFPTPGSVPAPPAALMQFEDAPPAKPLTVVPSLGPNECDVFLRLLRTGDSIVQRTSAMVLATLLAAVPATSGAGTVLLDEGAVEALAVFLAEQLALASRAASVMESAVTSYLPALSVLLRRSLARTVFLARGGVTALAAVLQALLVAGTNSQLTYEATFCMWTLALTAAREEDAAAAGGVVRDFLAAGAVRSIISALAAAPSRKVVRMSVAALRALARRESPELLTEMLTCGLDKLLGNMVSAGAHTQAGDADVETDVTQLHAVLLRNYRELTAFDKWAAEVASGQLRWGITHTDTFWKENAALVEKDDFKWLRALVNIISSSTEAAGEEALCVALYDLGQFARFYPNGRGVLKALGARDRVMRMVEHPSAEVGRTALQCVSKMMISHWEFVK